MLKLILICGLCERKSEIVGPDELFLLVQAHASGWYAPEVNIVVCPQCMDKLISSQREDPANENSNQSNKHKQQSSAVNVNGKIIFTSNE